MNCIQRLEAAPSIGAGTILFAAFFALWSCRARLVPALLQASALQRQRQFINWMTQTNSVIMSQQIIGQLLLSWGNLGSSPQNKNGNLKWNFPLSVGLPPPPLMDIISIHFVISLAIIVLRFVFVGAAAKMIFSSSPLETLETYHFQWKS